ncbi:hypothetical protein L323_00345 [Ruminiclostridium papyrosolvens C7]|uniref:Uncharacterized protein n=1 Tax=Ruminiclostridium papyrosolvens C7 TaxID=1330534 RepID=U4R7G6_9FIRM|nr:hypothetical protein L323_00345 [Ruminiclostridium papyrosolvens C7]
MTCKNILTNCRPEEILISLAFLMLKSLLAGRVMSNKELYNIYANNSSRRKT